MSLSALVGMKGNEIVIDSTLKEGDGGHFAQESTYILGPRLHLVAFFFFFCDGSVSIVFCLFFLLFVTPQQEDEGRV